MNCNSLSTLEECLHKTSTSIIEEDEQACGGDANPFKEERVFFMPKIYFVILKQSVGSIERFHWQAFMKQKSLDCLDDVIQILMMIGWKLLYLTIQYFKMQDQFFSNLRRRDDKHSKFVVKQLDNSHIKATWVFGEEMHKIDSNLSAGEVKSLHI